WHRLWRFGGDRCLRYRARQGIEIGDCFLEVRLLRRRNGYSFRRAKIMLRCVGVVLGAAVRAFAVTPPAAAAATAAPPRPFAVIPRLARMIRRAELGLTALVIRAGPFVLALRGKAFAGFGGRALRVGLVLRLAVHALTVAAP